MHGKWSSQAHFLVSRPFLDSEMGLVLVGFRPLVLMRADSSELPPSRPPLSCSRPSSPAPTPPSLHPSLQRSIDLLILIPSRFPPFQPANLHHSLALSPLSSHPLPPTRPTDNGSKMTLPQTRILRLHAGANARVECRAVGRKAAYFYSHPCSGSQSSFMPKCYSGGQPRLKLNRVQHFKTV